MFFILPIENWAIIYKILIIVTIIFHPNMMFRKFAFWFSVSWMITGFFKEYYLSGSEWFMMQAVHELLTLIITGRLLKESPLVRYIVTIQAVGFLGLNILQFQTITDWFMPPVDYIWWNMLGFELILLSLWFNTKVLDSIKRQWTFENVTMVYIIGWVIFLAGNY
ncbi:hypothetical protein S140_15 [Shewanella sp. phage 1/40]|uniref:hypothetical protein n=1 Tax=Shewanella sp. phage 1/40 TaxID=1458860 RepID=UPI0004F85979|nr:hypothetical protein S140_15 [Shewanella sp. phage 1/40]AHK11425.1 hypothetical protein S140_15 [Shewanella sp. phage 1/40]